MAATDEAFGYFAVTGVADTVVLLAQIQRLAIERHFVELADATGIVLTGMLEDLNAIAQQYALLADTTIIRILIETRAQNRPMTGDLATHIVSEPGPLGSVRVALIEKLDEVVNPHGGYGPFWRAQEYGTGNSAEGIPSQVGRYLRGFFEPSGTPPDAAQRGLRTGTDLAFMPDANGGPGRITVDLPGRHFLTGGTAEVGAKYLQRIGELERTYAERIEKLRELLAKARTGRMWYYFLDA